MNPTQFVKEALAPFNECHLVEGQIAVTTHCLYPSNEAVTVYVSGGKNGALVSDEGAAIDVLSVHKRLIPDSERYLRRFCTAPGLRVLAGKICSPEVSFDQLSAAVVLVANASAAAAHWGIEHIKVHKERDLRGDLFGELRKRFSKDQIQQDAKLTGKSSRRYRFDSVVTLDRGRLLAIDAVLPDANSINSHAIAHLDLRQKEDKNIIQRLVYDDEQEWNAADLNLLQMAAAVAPFSKLDVDLKRVMAH